MKLYNTNQEFRLESGEIIENLQIAYHTFGTFDPAQERILHQSIKRKNQESNQIYQFRSLYQL